MLIKSKTSQAWIESLRNTKPANMIIDGLYDVHSNSHVHIYSKSMQFCSHYVSTHYMTLTYNENNQQVITIYHPTRSFQIVDPFVIKDDNSEMIAVGSKIGYISKSGSFIDLTSCRPVLDTFFIFNSHNGIDSYPNGPLNVFTRYIREYIENDLNKPKSILKETHKPKYKYKYQANIDEIKEMRKKNIKNTINGKYDIESNQPIYIVEYNKDNKCESRPHYIASQYIELSKNSLNEKILTVYHANRSYRIVQPLIISNRATGMLGVVGSKVYVDGVKMFKNSNGKLIGNLTHFIFNFEMPLVTIRGLTYEFSNFIEAYKNNINKIEKEVTTNGK